MITIGKSIYDKWVKEECPPEDGPTGRTQLQLIEDIIVHSSYIGNIFFYKTCILVELLKKQPVCTLSTSAVYCKDF